MLHMALIASPNQYPILAVEPPKILSKKSKAPCEVMPGPSIENLWSSPPERVWHLRQSLELAFLLL